MSGDLAGLGCCARWSYDPSPHKHMRKTIQSQDDIGQCMFCEHLLSHVWKKKTIMAISNPDNFDNSLDFSVLASDFSEPAVVFPNKAPSIAAPPGRNQPVKTCREAAGGGERGQGGCGRFGARRRCAKSPESVRMALFQFVFFQVFEVVLVGRFKVLR